LTISPPRRLLYGIVFGIAGAAAGFFLGHYQFGRFAGRGVPLELIFFSGETTLEKVAVFAAGKVIPLDDMRFRILCAAGFGLLLGLIAGASLARSWTRVGRGATLCPVDSKHGTGELTRRILLRRMLAIVFASARELMVICFLIFGLFLCLAFLVKWGHTGAEVTITW
jgi:hypothetical protein